MSTTIRIAVISTLALFALLIIGPSARADGVEKFEITGHSDQAVCQLFDAGPCAANVSFDFEAKVKPYYSWLEVLSLTGEINGQRIHAPHPDGLLMPGGNIVGAFNDIRGPIPFAPGVPDYLQLPTGEDVLFNVGAGKYFLGFDDMLTGSMYIGGVSGSDVLGGPITWDAERVVTPEPSTLLLLCVGIVALGALGTAKHFL
jgi:hypothetical protein